MKVNKIISTDFKKACCKLHFCLYTSELFPSEPILMIVIFYLKTGAYRVVLLLILQDLTSSFYAISTTLMIFSFYFKVGIILLFFFSTF